MYRTLGELVGGGIVEGIEEGRGKLDAEAEGRRRDAIAKLEEGRKRKRAEHGRARNYEEREVARAAPAAALGGDVEARLKLPGNERACRHFFAGSGCVRGDKCRFDHELA